MELLWLTLITMLPAFSRSLLHFSLSNNVLLKKTITSQIDKLSMSSSLSSSSSSSSLSKYQNLHSAGSHNANSNNSNKNKITNKNGKSIAINILVDSRIRTYLNMQNYERKSRVILPAEMAEERITNVYLRELIEKKLMSLCNQPYVVRIHIPGTSSSPKQYSSDKELFESLIIAQTNQLSSVQLYVDILPGVFPPPNLDYLKSMLDPHNTDTYTLLSFYTFKTIVAPAEVEVELRELWRPFGAVGRVYIATEGINAQMAVPTNILSNFAEACRSHHILADVMLNTDHEITKEQFEENRPFKALHIRIRDQIVADGWKDDQSNNNNLNNFDWNKAGREMPPLEWHEQLDNPEAIILDCRNSYESDVGKFNGAIALNTTFFRESWTALDEILENTPKDAPIMTYCTGGIRCVKINAYLEQRLGFSNVSRLQGGIISYTREVAKANEEESLLQQQQQEPEQAKVKEIYSTSAAVATAVTTTTTTLGKDDDKFDVQFINPSPDSTVTTASRLLNLKESKFRGVNYVFDERMISSSGSGTAGDVLAACETCGDACDRFTNCKSDHCHIRYIQCGKCCTQYDGCCSGYCQSLLQTLSRGHSSSEGINSQASQQAIKINKNMITRASSSSSSSEFTERGLSSMTTSGPVPASISPAVSVSVSASSEVNANSSNVDVDVDGGRVEPIHSLLPSVSSPLTPPRSPSPSRTIQSLSVSTQDAVGIYCDRYSTPEPPLLRQLRHMTETQYFDSEGALRMLCSVTQGRLFAMLALTSQARHVLELGTFTGYSALCFAESLAANSATAYTPPPTTGDGGSSSECKPAVSVVTCDIDDKAVSIASDFISQSKYAHFIEIHKTDADTMIDTLGNDFEMMASSSQIPHDNELLTAERTPRRQFDIVFIDADKRQYISYIQKIINKKLIRPGGMFLVDNTLWKGLVVHKEEDLMHAAEDYSKYGKKERIMKLTDTMHEFNQFVLNHKELQSLLLPLRDGLTMVRYNPMA